MNYSPRRELSENEVNYYLPNTFVNFLMSMIDCLLDADGYTQEIRHSIVDRAMTRVRAHNIEPQPEVLAIYAQYVAGTISRQESSNLMFTRFQMLYDRAMTSLERGC